MFLSTLNFANFQILIAISTLKNHTSHLQKDQNPYQNLIVRGFKRGIKKKNHQIHMEEDKSRSKKGRKGETVDDDGGGDKIECSGKYCGSCTGGLIAECVAVCCCPCAVVPCLAFAFVKAPWVVGRRCLGLGKKKKGHKRSSKRKYKNSDEMEKDVSVPEGIEMEMEIDSVIVNAAFEAEKVWVELYQIGHLDFGRVS